MAEHTSRWCSGCSGKPTSVQAGPRRTQERLRGFHDALRAAGRLELAEIRSGPYTHEAGRAAALDLLSLGNPPDAVFSGGVLLTLGVLQACRERGVVWPEEIGLVGYGDARWASVLVPPLTVVEQPVEQLGEIGIRLLLSSIRRRVTGQRVVLESRLVVRRSHWRSLNTQASLSVSARIR